MSLSTIIQLRLEMLIEHIKGGEQVVIGPKSKLGVPPIGWQDQFIKTEFLLRLNDNENGFTDLFEGKKKLAKSDVKEGTNIGDLATSIAAISEIKTVAQYEIKMRERVRLGLRAILAAKKGVPAQSVMPGDQIRQYFDLANQGEARTLTRSVNGEFRKYLLTPLALSELDTTVATLQNRVTYHTIA